MKTKKELFRREYLRGLLDGTRSPVKPRSKTVPALFRRYTKYLKDNPTVKDELKNSL